ncbi:uncharacterized protein LOC128558100 [Mercenaria mercenaria]|uniref:uncharacterized protein LOC128558100 n=1 Tax=Mercenaria mercenaria TaxID=6596 RepID=UPI00234E89C3|nr:uncharacterized protein LOC128558100 [Mercenaria mercenaria]
MSKAAVCCTVIRAKVVTALLALFSLALYSGMPRVTAVVLDNENNTVCTVVEEHSEVDTIYFFLDAALILALPLLVTTILFGAIFLKKQCDNSSSLTAARQRRLSEITKVLLVIVIIDVVLKAPSFINKARLVILAEHYGKQYDMPGILLQQIFQLVSYLSVCAHVLCYIAFSRNFRKTARQLLHCT